MVEPSIDLEFSRLAYVKDYCQDVEDGLDGFYIHSFKCRYYPKGWIGGTDCINVKTVDFEIGMQ